MSKFISEKGRDSHRSNIRVYMACPYTHKDPIIESGRYAQANKAAAYLMDLGYIVFSPITHSHPVDQHVRGTRDHMFWLGQDKHFIDWADKMIILTLEGWDTSFGVTWERGFAEAQNKEIVLLSYEVVEIAYQGEG